MQQARKVAGTNTWEAINPIAGIQQSHNLDCEAGRQAVSKAMKRGEHPHEWHVPLNSTRRASSPRPDATSIVHSLGLQQTQQAITEGRMRAAACGA